MPFSPGEPNAENQHSSGVTGIIKHLTSSTTYQCRGRGSSRQSWGWYQRTAANIQWKYISSSMSRTLKSSVSSLPNSYLHHDAAGGLTTDGDVEEDPWVGHEVCARDLLTKDGGEAI